MKVVNGLRDSCWYFVISFTAVFDLACPNQVKDCLCLFGIQG
jgi:hypothetical protein